MHKRFAGFLCLCLSTQGIWMSFQADCKVVWNQSKIWTAYNAQKSVLNSLVLDDPRNPMFGDLFYFFPKDPEASCLQTLSQGYFQLSTGTDASP